MIRRILCLLIVPLMLGNQTLCIAHSHHGTEIAEPEGHASRSHFHLGDHTHHDSKKSHRHDGDHSSGDHSSGDQRSGDGEAAVSQALASGCDHDADALYCSETVNFARDGNSFTTGTFSVKYIAAAGILLGADQCSDALMRLDQPPPVFGSACPIYLRTLSLRI